jgi:histidine ammonia-lyase
MILRNGARIPPPPDAARRSSDRCLSWAQVAKVAEGAPLSVSDGALGEFTARALVTSIVGQGVRAYGVNTGVGAVRWSCLHRNKCSYRETS